MSTVRKRKLMLRKLNTYFEHKGKILSEREYMQETQPPFRIYAIKKYLGGWPRMQAYLKYYWPAWAGKTVEEVAPPKEDAPKINLDALKEFDNESND